MKHHRRLFSVYLSAVFLISLFFISGCDSQKSATDPPVPTYQEKVLALEAENSAWDTAHNTNTAEAYLNYLTNYPDGRYAELAKERILAMTKQPTPVIKPDDKPEPKTETTTESMLREDNDLWKNIVQSNTIEGYDHYLTVFPDGEHRQQAIENRRNLIQQAETETAVQLVDPFNNEMIFVNGGTFMMGCTVKQDQKCYNSEEPRHRVTVSGFYMSIYPVTQAQWTEIMGNNPSDTNCPGCPVTNVSWYDAQSFIERLNNNTGKNYRLPTEAEWEFAARGGREARGFVYAGSNVLDRVAFYDNNSNNRLHPVGGKQPNALGLYDMSGLVQEWCQDWYGEYSNTAKQNPQGPASGRFRVLRGGAYNVSERYCRVSSRSYRPPADNHFNVGFRLVKDF